SRSAARVTEPNERTRPRSRQAPRRASTRSLAAAARSESDPDVDANADGREDSGAGILKADWHDQLAEHRLAVQDLQQPMVDDRREAPRGLVHVERGSQPDAPAVAHPDDKAGMNREVDVKRISLQ